MTSGRRAQDPADHQRDSHGDEADFQRNAGAVDHAAENVPSELIGSEKVGGAGRLQHCLQILRAVAIGCDKVRENGAQHQNDQNHKADHGQLVSAQAPPGIAPKTVFLFPVIHVPASLTGTET